MGLVADFGEQLDAIIALQRKGETAQALAVAEQARDVLAADPLLTTGEVRDLLGVRSVNTVKSTSRAGDLPFERRGNRMRIRHSAVERAIDSEARRRGGCDDWRGHTPRRRCWATRDRSPRPTAMSWMRARGNEADRDELDAGAGQLPWQR